MKRLALIPLAALALLAASLPPANAATNEIKPCSKDNGWQIAAGNLSPRFPKTKCSFAERVYDIVDGRRGSLEDLPKRFPVTESAAEKLRCKAKSSGSYAEFRCKSSDRFVLAYKYR